MRLVDRDERVLREVWRWRFLQGRHVRYLASFSSPRTADRRLRVLLENNYLDRKKYLYGVSSLYTITASGRNLLGVSNKADKIRIEQIIHNIAMLDSVVYFIKKYNVSLDNILSEKQLHSSQGFGNRKHVVDFVFVLSDKSFGVEIELTLKAKKRLISNIEDNFTRYDYQVWIVPTSEHQIKQILDDTKAIYPNIKVLNLEEVQDYVKQLD